MKTFKCNESISVCGVSFANIDELLRYALSGEAKDGIYVGTDSEAYPCFDSSDSAYEDRRYWNFVFAMSKADLDRKMALLKTAKLTGANYCKLTAYLHPMAYWQGDTYHPIIMSEEEKPELVVEEMNDDDRKAFDDIAPKKVGKLDMVIAFDTTGSMAAYIGAVRAEVAELVPNLFKANEDLRLGIVAFGDYCDMVNAYEFGDAYQCLPLTNNENDIVKFVRESKDTSGGDGDEFYELVIKKIVEESSWREGSTKVILLISDAEPHELGYTYQDYVIGNQIDWRKEAKKAADMKIKIDTVTITNAPWYKELSALTNGVSVPFRSGHKTARLVEAATMARGSSKSRMMFDKLADYCADDELRNVFLCYRTARNEF